MREIKFRAWDKEKNKMLGWENDDGGMQNTPLGMIINRDYIELMQYTGLKDKTGREIYEGDILEFTFACANHPQKYVVEWEYKSHEWKLHNADMNDYLEIIGNIYENPEKIKEEKKEK